MPPYDNTRPPPPIEGTERGGPRMAQSPRSADLLLNLAGRGQDQGGGATEQAVRLVMQAAQMLFQAGQLDPTVAPVIQETLITLQRGLSGLGGPPATPRRRRGVPTATPPMETPPTPPEGL